MKIAVPTRDGRVDDLFGHCAYYSIFEVIDGKVISVSKMIKISDFAIVNSLYSDGFNQFLYLCASWCAGDSARPCGGQGSSRTGKASNVLKVGGS